MAQYSTGTVSVSIGTNAWVGVGTDWSNINPGDEIKIQSEVVFYVVQAVADATHLTTTVVHPTGATGETYIITTDFTTKYSLPKMNQNDLNGADIHARAMTLIDAAIGSGGPVSGNTIITGEDATGDGQDAGEALTVNGGDGSDGTSSDGGDGGGTTLNGGDGGDAFAASGGDGGDGADITLNPGEGGAGDGGGSAGADGRVLIKGGKALGLEGSGTGVAEIKNTAGATDGAFAFVNRLSGLATTNVAIGSAGLLQANVAKGTAADFSVHGSSVDDALLVDVSADEVIANGALRPNGGIIAPATADMVLKLADAAGTYDLSITDSADAEVASIDSDGGAQFNTLKGADADVSVHGDTVDDAFLVDVSLDMVITNGQLRPVGGIVAPIAASLVVKLADAGGNYALSITDAGSAQVASIDSNGAAQFNVAKAADADFSIHGDTVDDVFLVDTSADKVITAGAIEAAGGVEAAATSDLVLKLADDGGTYKLSITDSGDAEVASIDSNGNISALMYTGDGSGLTNVGAADSAGVTKICRVGSGTITKGYAVYASGTIGATTTVELADNTDDAKSAVLGIAAETVTSPNLINVRLLGELTSTDTSSASGDGAIAYLIDAASTPNWSTTIPTVGEVHPFGIITVDHVSNGIITIKDAHSHVFAVAADEDIVLRVGDDIGANGVAIRNYSDTDVARIDSLGGAQFGGNVGIGALTDPDTALHIEGLLPDITLESTAGNAVVTIAGISDRNSANNGILNLDGYWGTGAANTLVGRVAVLAGADVGNLDDGRFRVQLATGGALTTRFVIDELGFSTFTGVVVMDEVSAPTGVADKAMLYAADVSATAEMFVVDGGDTHTQISPHSEIPGLLTFDPDGPLPFAPHHFNRLTGEHEQLDIAGALATLETLAAAAGLPLQKFVHKTMLPARERADAATWAAEQTAIRQARADAAHEAAKEAELENDPDPWVAVDKAEAVEEIDEMQDGETTEETTTRYELDPETGDSAARDVTEVVTARVPTGRKIPQLRAGYRVNRDTGEFQRPKTAADVARPTPEPVTQVEVPAWIAARRTAIAAR